MDRTSLRRLGVLLALLLHVVAVIAVWRDSGRRSTGELRGSRTFWRIASALNTGNALGYLLIGRRRAGPAFRSLGRR
jgi:hypothetical protein